MATLKEMIEKFRERCKTNPEIQKRIAKLKALAQARAEADAKAKEENANETK